MTGNRISIIVPTFKEAKSLPMLLGRIAGSIRERLGNYEIIVVDDNSRDGTAEIIAKIDPREIPVSLITRNGERGLSSAVLEGFRRAKGDILICMDADLSHPPEALPKLIEAIEKEDSEFVIGSRYVAGASTDENWGFYRWLNSKVATLLARPFTSAKDPMAGFFAIKKSRLAQADPLNPIGYKIGLELMVKCRCQKIREVPIHFADRKFGESKLRFREHLNYLKHLKRLADYKYGWVSHLAQFSLVGTTGMVVDLSVYAVLLSVGVPWLSQLILAMFPFGAFPAVHHAGIAVGIGRALAIWSAMTWNFFFNRRLTFSQSRGGAILRKYWKFVVGCTMGAIVNWGISIGLPNRIDFFKDHMIISAVFGIAGGTIFNFWVSKHWAFRRLKPPLS